ncbi:response regulator [Sphingosinicella sp. YJ22]|uniref:response regulator n=1 Tax=Sphingosinicella sp. YJ22 TaxID=1104780 RepID=UPI00140D5308|nr:response regulator [Sphingosinicella sp. YJ22]
MTHDASARDESASAAALRLSVHRSIARAMRRLVWALILVTGLGGALVFAFSGSPPPSWGVLAAMLAIGAVAGLILVRPVAQVLARLAVRPIELILAQPELIQDIGEEELNWQKGRALSRADIESDLDALSRHLRRITRRSREAMVELQTAREEAKQQNIAQSQFLAKMSHELRTPLNAILGYAMLVQEDATAAGNATAVADLERIQVAGRNLLAVINDVLDHARIEAGKTMIERNVIDIRELAMEAAASCPADQRNGNSFDVDVSDALGIMVGDAGKVRQCLLNLLSNAFKFTTNGHVSLVIAPTRSGGAAGVRFDVRDTGPGIAAADLPHLFDAFSQLEDGDARRFGGPGLGLAITRRLARMMGGDCTVESVEGQGSTFCLTLPLSLKKAQGEATILFRSDHPLPVRSSERSALIVDDDEAAIDLMRRWLARLGYDVFAATDGETGLAMAREHRPDLILLDALLPGISGYDVLAELRADVALSRTPVVLVTVDDDRARGLSAGASDYLRKPIREEQLRAVAKLYESKAQGDVLVIDDDDDAAELIKRSVEQIGFSTRRACDGLEGVEMASTTPPAAIVLDLAMPGLDGFGVIERLSADEKLMHIPLIIVSGCDVSLHQHRALAAAGYRFFAKGSSTPREIAQSLRELVA